MHLQGRAAAAVDDDYGGVAGDRCLVLVFLMDVYVMFPLSLVRR